MLRLDGEAVKVKSAGGADATGPTGAESCVEDPDEFVAVTVTVTVLPTSVDPRR
jgi:hypothetical protein